MSRRYRAAPASAAALWLAGRYAEALALDPLVEFREDLPAHLMTRAELDEAHRLREAAARVTQAPRRGRRRKL
jgi:hypothetical protein